MLSLGLSLWMGGRKRRRPPAPPTLNSITIAAAPGGISRLTLVFSEAVTSCEASEGDFTLDGDSSWGIEYVSGNGTATVLFDVETHLLDTEGPFTLSYTPGAIESVATGADLEAIVDEVVTNSLPAPPLTSVDGIFSVTESKRGSYLWQDAGKTTLAAADGDPVRVFKCTRTGKEYTSPSDSTRMILTSLGNDIWCLTSDGVDDGYEPSVSFASHGNTTIAIRASVSSAADNRILSGWMTANNVLTLRRASLNFFVNGDDAYDAALVADANHHTVVIMRDNTLSMDDWKLFVDGVEFVCNASNEAWTRVGIGGVGPYTESFAGTLSCVPSYTQGTDNPTRAQLEAYLEYQTP